VNDGHDSRTYARYLEKRVARLRAQLTQAATCLTRLRPDVESATQHAIDDLLAPMREELAVAVLEQPPQPTTTSVLEKPRQVVLLDNPAETIGYACPLCGLFASPEIYVATKEVRWQAAYEMAERCCQRQCTRCGARVPRERFFTHCEACEPSVRSEKAAVRRSQATRVPEAEYAGPVFIEDSTLGKQGFFRSTDDLRDEFEDLQDDGEELPEEVWACSQERLTLSAENILESAFDGHHEDAYDQLAPGASQHLQVVLDQWVTEKAADVESWEPDYARLVVLTLPHTEEAP
jgi:hypothetical protein